MTEEQTDDDRITDPAFALKVLVGSWGQWMRAERLYPEPTFEQFLDRMQGFLGWTTPRILDAIALADIVVPESGEPEANRATFYRCFEVITGRRWD